MQAALHPSSLLPWLTLQSLLPVLHRSRQGCPWLRVYLPRSIPGGSGCDPISSGDSGRGLIGCALPVPALGQSAVAWRLGLVAQKGCWAAPLGGEGPAKPWAAGRRDVRNSRACHQSCPAMAVLGAFGCSVPERQQFLALRRRRTALPPPSHPLRSLTPRLGASCFVRRCAAGRHEGASIIDRVRGKIRWACLCFSGCANERNALSGAERRVGGRMGAPQSAAEVGP